jgi:hypothetical protein
MKNLTTKTIVNFALILSFLLVGQISQAQSSITKWVEDHEILVDGPVAVDRLLSSADLVTGGGQEDDANNSGITGLPQFYRRVAAEIRDNNLNVKQAINLVAAAFLTEGFTAQNVTALVASTRMILS